MRLDHRSFQDINDAMYQESGEEDSAQEAFDDEGREISTNTTSPQDKIKLERQKLMESAANGEVKPQGWYFFYRIFVFLGGLAFFLAFVSIGILVYTMIQILKENRNEEGQGLIS